MSDLMKAFIPRQHAYHEKEDCIGYFCRNCDRRVATTTLSERDLDLALFKPCKCGGTEYVAMLTKRKKQ